MSRREIPKATEITCDICRKVCDRADYVLTSVLKITRGATDYQGCAVGHGGREWDVCDSCIHKLERALDDTVTAIRKAKP